MLPPPLESAVPYLDLAALDDAVTRLTASARAFDAGYAAQFAAGVALPVQRVREVNALLRGLEQALTDARGLPGRSWYTNLIYAPGLLSGYGAKTLPGVREAIEQGQWQVAEDYARRTAAALNLYSEQLDRASVMLRRVD